jgi:hypothetical protein
MAKTPEIELLAGTLAISPPAEAIGALVRVRSRAGRRMHSRR